LRRGSKQQAYQLGLANDLTAFAYRQQCHLCRHATSTSLALHKKTAAAPPFSREEASQIRCRAAARAHVSINGHPFRPCQRVRDPLAETVGVV
jgi:hypothetical protein